MCGRSRSRATTDSASIRPTRWGGGAMAGATRTTRTPRPPRARGRRGRRGRRAVRSALASSCAHSCSAPPGRRAPHGRHTCGEGALPVHNACGAPLQMVYGTWGSHSSGDLPTVKRALPGQRTHSAISCARSMRMAPVLCIESRASICEYLLQFVHIAYVHAIIDIINDVFLYYSIRSYR